MRTGITTLLLALLAITVACGGNGRDSAEDEWARSTCAILNDWSDATRAVEPTDTSGPLEAQTQAAADRYLRLANAAAGAAGELRELTVPEGAKSYHRTLIALTEGLEVTHHVFADEALAATTPNDLTALEANAELVVRVQSGEAFVFGHRSLSEAAAEAFARTTACEPWQPENVDLDY